MGGKSLERVKETPPRGKCARTGEGGEGEKKREEFVTISPSCLIFISYSIEIGGKGRHDVNKHSLSRNGTKMAADN